MNTNQIQRSFASEADYEGMLELLRDIVSLEPPPYLATTGDLEWWYGWVDDPNFLSTVSVWRHNNKVVGFLWPSEGWPTAHFADAFAHPDCPELLNDILAFGEEQCRQKGGDALGVLVYARDAERQRLVMERSYTRLQETGVQRLCKIVQAPLASFLPNGYSVASLEDADVHSRVRAQQSASGSRLTDAMYQRVRSLSTYRADLDIVVKAANGEVASYCLAWVDGRNNFAIFEPVGCHKDHQRKGLTKAAMIEGLRRLWELGVRQAQVGNVSDNIAAGNLYQSAGFEEIDRLDTYTKALI